MNSLDSRRLYKSTELTEKDLSEQSQALGNNLAEFSDNVRLFVAQKEQELIVEENKQYVLRFLEPNDEQKKDREMEKKLLLELTQEWKDILQQYNYIIENNYRLPIYDPSQDLAKFKLNYSKFIAALKEIQSKFEYFLRPERRVVKFNSTHEENLTSNIEWSHPKKDYADTKRQKDTYLVNIICINHIVNLNNRFQKEMQHAQVDNEPILIILREEGVFFNTTKFFFYANRFNEKTKKYEWGWFDETWDRDLLKSTKSIKENKKVTVSELKSRNLANFHEKVGSSAGSIEYIVYRIRKHEASFKANLVYFKEMAQILIKKMECFEGVCNEINKPVPEKYLSIINRLEEQIKLLEEAKKDDTLIFQSNLQLQQNLINPILDLAEEVKATETETEKLINDEIIKNGDLDSDSTKKAKFKYYVDSLRPLMGADLDAVGEKARVIQNKLNEFKSNSVKNFVENFAEEKKINELLTDQIEHLEKSHLIVFISLSDPNFQYNEENFKFIKKLYDHRVEIFPITEAGFANRRYRARTEIEIIENALNETVKVYNDLLQTLAKEKTLTAPLKGKNEIKKGIELSIALEKSVLRKNLELYSKRLNEAIDKQLEEERKKKELEESKKLPEPQTQPTQTQVTTQTLVPKHSGLAKPQPQKTTTSSTSISVASSNNSVSVVSSTNIVQIKPDSHTSRNIAEGELPPNTGNSSHVIIGNAINKNKSTTKPKSVQANSILTDVSTDLTVVDDSENAEKNDKQKKDNKKDNRKEKKSKSTLRSPSNADSSSSNSSSESEEVVGGHETDSEDNASQSAYESASDSETTPSSPSSEPVESLLDDVPIADDQQNIKNIKLLKEIYFSLSMNDEQTLRNLFKAMPTNKDSDESLETYRKLKKAVQPRWFASILGRFDLTRGCLNHEDVPAKYRTVEQNKALVKSATALSKMTIQTIQSTDTKILATIKHTLKIAEKNETNDRLYSETNDLIIFNERRKWSQLPNLTLWTQQHQEVTKLNNKVSNKVHIRTQDIEDNSMYNQITKLQKIKREYEAIASSFESPQEKADQLKMIKLEKQKIEIILKEAYKLQKIDPDRLMISMRINDITHRYSLNNWVKKIQGAYNNCIDKMNTESTRLTYKQF